MMESNSVYKSFKKLTTYSISKDKESTYETRIWPSLEVSPTYLKRSALGRHLCEADDVAEIDGDGFVGFRFDAKSPSQSLSHGSAIGCQPLEMEGQTGKAQIYNNKKKD